MKKTDMITTIQNKERDLWHNVQVYKRLMNDRNTESTEALYKMARSHWSAVYSLMQDLGIEATH